MLQELGIDVSLMPETTEASIRPLPARQQRSRDTLARLLDATEEVLAEKGYEGTTVPAIAGRAGLSVGVLYRRFPDKDALLRAVWGRFFFRVREKKDELAEWKLPVPETASGAVGWLVRNLIESYRRNRRILRALSMYSRTHPDPEFREEAAAMNAESLRLTAQLLDRWRSQIRHPDPDKAISNGLVFVTSILRETILADQSLRPWMDMPGEELEEELTRLLIGYLDLEPTSTADRPRRSGGKRK